MKKRGFFLVFLIILSHHPFLYSQSNDKQEIKKETVKETVKKNSQKNKKWRSFRTSASRNRKRKSKNHRRKRRGRKNKTRWNWKNAERDGWDGISFKTRVSGNPNCSQITAFID